MSNGYKLCVTEDHNGRVGVRVREIMTGGLECQVKNKIEGEW